MKKYNLFIILKNKICAWIFNPFSDSEVEEYFRSLGWNFIFTPIPIISWVTNLFETLVSIKIPATFLLFIKISFGHLNLTLFKPKPSNMLIRIETIIILILPISDIFIFFFYQNWACKITFFTFPNSAFSSSSILLINTKKRWVWTITIFNNFFDFIIWIIKIFEKEKIKKFLTHVILPQKETE